MGRGPRRQRVLGLGSFDEDDLYAALDDLFVPARKRFKRQALFRLYLRRKAAPPRLFLYDVTSSYFEGERNELGEFGYNRDGKQGKLQIVIGLMTDAEGEPLAVRVFAGNTSDPVTVLSDQNCQRAVWGGGTRLCGRPRDGEEQGPPSARAGGVALHRGTDGSADPSSAGGADFAMELFSEQICEVEDVGARYVLRKNEREAARERHRLEDKLEKLKERSPRATRRSRISRAVDRKRGSAKWKCGPNGTN